MAQTQAQQMTKIAEDLTALHKEHGEAIEAMRKQVGRLEERMETYEDQTKENTAILKENTVISKENTAMIKEVQHAVTGFYSTLEKIGRSVRYILITVASIAAGIVVIVVANWLLVLWHIHP